MKRDEPLARRELILTVAERLFAEHGVFAVSNRQISEAAGQGNNTAVGYHFGTKADLVRAIVIEETQSSSTLMRIVDGRNRCLPKLPPEVLAERGDMARQLMMHMVAERELALAEGTPTPRASWHDAATGLVDALVGLWLAPVSEKEKP